MPKEIQGRNGGKLVVPTKGDPTLNAAGRGKGTLNSKTIIRKWLEAVEKSKNPINGAMENLSQLDIITLKQLEKARKGDTMAFRELLDRMEGKASQSVDVTSDGEKISTTTIIWGDGKEIKL